ncbi:RpiB/LacA/LacB family sugar-phosphate isomerase [Candidatus Haliotispira prima]|uniref:RpiB/LacA/LacB family sugar-phosphate isomerase n=1 Tax=Candidatus Haliotispira prima TaxID=3034016 RepID=A0ABY8MFZ8_9SPIO|nr:RpiB/LacA/LacB family sugar-phosphate isomerase [Candidatus Haliotispira prima]
MSEEVVIAGDHSSPELKRRLSRYLEQRGYQVDDLGVYNSDSVNYAEFAEKACLKYLEGGYAFGVLVCGTGIGISISANKVRGIRCALPQNVFAAGMTKKHNDANFIAFGARIEYSESPEEILGAYLDAAFEGGRHAIRVEYMMGLEQLKPN